MRAWITNVEESLTINYSQIPHHKCPLRSASRRPIRRCKSPSHLPTQEGWVLEGSHQNNGRELDDSVRYRTTATNFPS